MNKIDNHENKFKYPIHSVENAFSLLETLADNGFELGIAELCKKIALPKGTVHRLLGTLKNLGYIEQNPQNRKYYLTIKVFKLGTAVTDRVGLVQIIPHMKKLSRKFNETVNLAILDRDEIIYLYSMGSDNTLKLDLKIGSNQPAYCAAVGKVLLAYLSERELDGYLQRVILKSYTSHTITSKEYLKKDLKLIKERGYSFVNEEYMVGISCVAVPIKNQQGKVCAGLSFSIPTVRMDKEKLPQLIDSLISTAKKITIPGFF
ncbi:IclR family transcriptional regulator [Candidatus Atribacteria bacterium MT.SAG.1]|nr:IclR family transcriptional regulator [Candidatus Atribacteria bacterium MT.SAG.1]